LVAQGSGNECRHHGGIVVVGWLQRAEDIEESEGQHRRPNERP